MTTPDIDAARLAALIDGRLPPDEREKILAAIDASPELREVYADALAATADTVGASAVTPRRRTLPSFTPLQWLGIAAAAAVVIAVTPLLLRQLASPALPTTGVMIASLPVVDDSLRYMFDQPVFGATRGNAESLSPTARGIRVGSAVTSYELLRRRNDSTSSAAALRIASLLEGFPGGALAANAYRALATTPSGAGTSPESAAALASQAAGDRNLRLGVWLEGARFAAATRNSAYFSTSVVRDVARAAIAVDERADSEIAARQFEQVATRTPLDWTAITTAVEDLLRHLGTR
ncbi:MAG TPA: hypothetical protein VF128_02785 [Gemmatimonadaceae bacterium]